MPREYWFFSLDAVLRSSLYSHFSESLSGLATIRAYGESNRFRLDNETRIDIENRAYWLTVANQVIPLLPVYLKGCLLTSCFSIGSGSVLSALELFWHSSSRSWLLGLASLFHPRKQAWFFRISWLYNNRMYPLSFVRFLNSLLVANSFQDLAGSFDRALTSRTIWIQ